MRAKALAAWITLGVAIILGYIGRAAEVDAFYLLSGAGFLGALGIGISYLPFWGRWRERVPEMPGLFPKTGGLSWDSSTGQPAVRKPRRK